MYAESEYKVGDVVAGKYVIESILDPSTNSQSFLGNENYSEEKICVKSYYPQISSDYLQSPNFFLGANTVTALEHDNIVRTYEVNEEMGRIYLVRGFVQGRNFDQWLAEERNKPGYISSGLTALWQACQGLQKMHETGRHLNLHPRNIIISDMGAKVVDWDPRGMTSIDITRYLPTLSLFSCYRAPEMRADGMAAYPSSDLYSMGAMVYRLVFQSHPPENYDGITANLNLPEPPINEFLSRALHPEPEKRYQDAESFSNGLWALSDPLAKVFASGQSASSGLGAGLTASSPAPADPLPDGGASFAPSSSEGFNTADSVPDQSFGGQEAGASFAPEPSAPPPPPPPQAPEQPGYQPTMFEAGPPAGESKPSGDFQSSLEQPADNYTPPPEFHPGTDTSKKMSLEDKEYGNMDPGSKEASYSMFGFKGLQQNQTGVYSPPKPKEKNPKTKIFIILGVFAVIFVVLAALVIQRVTSPAAQTASEVSEPVMEAEVQTDYESREVPQDRDLQAQPEAVPAAEPEAETPAASPEPEAAKVQAAVVQPETAVPGKYKGNEKVSARREKQIMEMYESEQWPANAGECLKMGDDMNDLGRTLAANLVYQQVLKYPAAAASQRVSALGALAVTYHKLGNTAEAKSSLRKLLQVDPNNRFAKSYMGKLE